MELSDITTDESIRASPHQIFLPGCFVVLQGIAGDGLANTIETCPDCHYDDDYEDNDNDDDDDDELEAMDEDNAGAEGANEEVPPLEEDHFRPDANLNSANLGAGSNVATAPAPAAPPARMLGPSGNLVLSTLAARASQNPAACVLNNPSALLAAPSTAPSTTQPPQTAGRTRSNSTSSAIASTAAVVDNNTGRSGGGGISASSYHSPPENDDAFVVVASDSSSPTTPTRIRMYAQPGGAANANARRRMSRRKKRAIQQWTKEIGEKQKTQRQEWLMQEQQHHHQQEQQQQQQSGRGGSLSQQTSTAARETDWWLDSTTNQQTGYLAIYDALPRIADTGAVVTGQTIGVMPPGSTVMARKLYTLDSESLSVVQVDGADDETHQSSQSLLAPSIGCIQVLEVQISTTDGSSSSGNNISTSDPLPDLNMIARGGEPQQQSSSIRARQFKQPPRTQDSSTTTPTTKIGYCVYSVHGYAFLVPGIPSLYMDPQVWWWRVTCRVGAFLRQGLELSSDHTCTIPFGSFVQVTRKTVNRMGLSRLRVVAQLKDGDGTARQVEGWCSEFLNPLSGQRGHVVQPLPFPLPAVYRVTLPEGAIIREDVELSSRQVGEAPFGTRVTIVKRQFSEHPQDQCVERLKLAGDRYSGWISVRLNNPPPNDKCVVELVGTDDRFVPHKPGDFHWDVLAEEDRNTENTPRSRNNTGDISSIGSSSSSDPPAGGGGGAASPKRPATQHRGSGKNKSNHHSRQSETCLICLTEERNATIVHGETGHIACCLVCARILKARGDRCPVCRLEIDSVIQHFWA